MTIDDLRFAQDWIARMYGAAWIAFAMLSLLTRCVFLIPLMSVYAVLYGGYLLLAWDPHNTARFIPVELALLCLRVLAATETLLLAARYTPSQERRSLLLLLAAVGMLFLTITAGVGDGEGLLKLYRAVTWQVSIALGVIALIAAMAVQLYPARGASSVYAACVAWLLVVQGGQIAWYITAQTGRMRYWLTITIVKWALSLPAVLVMIWSLCAIVNNRKGPEYANE